MICEEEYWREHFLLKLQNEEPVYPEDLQYETTIAPEIQAKMDQWNKEVEEKELEEERKKLKEELKRGSADVSLNIPPSEKSAKRSVSVEPPKNLEPSDVG